MVRGDESFRDPNQRNVAVLGQLSQEVERGHRVDVVSLHDHSLGLTDDVAGIQRLSEPGGAAGVVEGDCGVRGVDRARLARDRVERARRVGEQIECPEFQVGGGHAD